jgi:site-specific recombinase XerD
MDCTALVTVEQPALPAELLEPLRLAADFAKASKAASTLVAYRSDVKIFTEWCLARGLAPMPPTPEALCAFLADEAARGRRPSTISRRLAAIKWAVEGAGVLEDTEKCPTDDKRVSAVLAGIRRTLGAAPKQKRAMTNDLVLGAVATNDGSLRALRDRAIVLLGFGGAFRRSELVAIDVADLQFCDSGLRVQIRRSKTDQSAEGVTIAVAAGSIACPAQAVRDWLEAANITTGAVFRRVVNRRNQRVTDRRLAARNIASVVKQCARRLGLVEADFAAHSLRAGWLTSAAARGASVFKMKEVSRHKSLDVLGGYVRDANLFRHSRRQVAGAD